MKFNENFRFLLNPSSFITVLQGSSGSGKTYSMLQMLIIKALSEWENKTIDIIRRTLPSHRIGAMKDFEDILKSLKLYSKKMHNKSEHSYKVGSCLFRFYSTDDEAKMRGPRRDVVYFNEVLELKKMDVVQVLMRTNDLVFMDFNPSDEFHWVYDDIIDSRDDVFFHKSTFVDNPFLPSTVRSELFRLKDMDDNLWRIYGLGERGVGEATIFRNWDYYKGSFDSFEGEELFGLDFGFNHPTAMVRVKFRESDMTLLVDELLYKGGLTSDLIVLELEKLKEKGVLSSGSSITADNARPEIISEISRAGFNVYPTKKGTKSVISGINFLKQCRILVTEGSVNLAKELRTYKWKVDKDDKVLDEPVKVNDDLCFIKGTLVLSEKGLVPIEKISLNDRVFTRDGFKDVLASGCTGVSSDLFEVVFSDGKSFIGSGSHPVWVVGKGWVCIRDLDKFYKVRVLPSNVWCRILDLKEKHTTKIKKLVIGNKAEALARYIAQFGKNIKAKFLKVIKYIIKMVTNPITKLTIWRWSPLKNIYACIGRRVEIKKARLGWMKSGILLRSGTVLKKVLNGIANIGRIVLVNLKRGLKRFVRIVQKSLFSKHFIMLGSFVLISVSRLLGGKQEKMMNLGVVCFVKNLLKSISIRKLGIVHVVAVTRLCGRKEKVFNLSVEGKSEYFANGVLVSNCDAFRYSVEDKMRGGVFVGVLGGKRK